MDQQAAVEWQVRNQVWNPVWGRITVTQLSSRVGAGSRVWDQVSEQVWATIGSQIRHRVDDQAVEDTDGSKNGS